MLYFVKNWQTQLFKNYFNFKGRLSRKDFWSFLLVNYALVFSIEFLNMSLPHENPMKKIIALCLIGYFLISMVAMISASCRRLRDSQSMLFNLFAFSVMALMFPIGVHFAFRIDIRLLRKAIDSYNFNLTLSGESPFYLWADFAIRLMYFVLPMGYCIYCLCKKTVATKTAAQAADGKTSKAQQALLKNAA